MSQALLEAIGWHLEGDATDALSALATRIPEDEEWAKDAAEALCIVLSWLIDANGDFNFYSDGSEEESAARIAEIKSRAQAKLLGLPEMLRAKGH